jgi:hypothetical protein
VQVKVRRLPVVVTTPPAIVETASPRNDLFMAPPSAAHEARRPAPGGTIAR